MRRCRACTSLVEAHADCAACGEPAPRAPKSSSEAQPRGWAARRGPRGMELAEAEAVALARDAGLLPTSRRPGGITLVAMPTFILGNGFLLAGVLGLLRIDGMAAALEPFPELQASSGLMFTALLLFGLLVSASGFGLLVGAKWSWWTTFAFYVLMTLTAAAGLFSGATASGLGIVLGAGALIALLSLRARLFVAVSRAPVRS